MSSIQKLAAEALEVQSACNLLAVAKSFAVVASQVRASLIEDGLPCDSEAVNRHPVVRVWSDKISSLTGRDTGIEDAFVKCHELAGGGQ